MARRLRADRPSLSPSESEPAGPVALAAWLRARADAGAIGNLVAFSLVAATAASRAAHGVLSPAALVAVVVGASVSATTTGWVAGFFEGARASLDGELHSVRATTADRLAGRRPWRGALTWGGWAAGWTACGAVVLAAILHDRSAPFAVVVVALLALALPAALGVDLAARAAGAAHGAALRDRRCEPVPLLRRAWVELALPIGGLQLVVNAGAAWLLFHSEAAEGTLTEGSAFGDAALMAALLASLFGVLGQRWGAVEVRSGRVRVSPEIAAQARRSPVGPQALVYAGVLTVLATSAAGIVVPAEPSLARVALVRGLLAGGLALVACALGVVRGAANAEPLGAAALDRAVLPPAPRAGRPALVGALAAVALVVTFVPLAAGPGPASAQGLDELGLVAELDALAVRVEVDIPLPAGSGSAPHVVGSVRRSAGGEAANGVASAPTHFDPVVGGRVADPNSDPGSGDESRLPQAECSYPGDLVDVAFTFPADLRPDSSSSPGTSPPIGHSTARCGAGPVTELHAVSASPDEPLAATTIASTGAGVADAAAGPADGVLSATASARASGISVLDGLLTVDSVNVHGASSTDGSAGSAVTEAVIDIEGIEVAGTRFDLRAGDLVVGGTALPLDGGAAERFLDSLSASLAPSGCDIAALGDPASYPQGFLFSRPEPLIGVAEDGSQAGSMSGGLLLQCDLPVDLTAPTGFSPARVQVVLGFVYTGVAATADIGGFDLGDVGTGTSEGGSGDGLAAPTSPSGSGGGALPVPAPAPGTAASTSATSGADDGPATVATSVVTRTVELLAANFTEGRPWVWGSALLLWLLLAHRGLERVRREILAAVS